MSSAELRKVRVRWDHIQLDAVAKISDCLNTPLETLTELRPLHGNKSKAINNNSLHSATA